MKGEPDSVPRHQSLAFSSPLHPTRSHTRSPPLARLSSSLSLSLTPPASALALWNLSGLPLWRSSSKSKKTRSFFCGQGERRGRLFWGLFDAKLYIFSLHRKLEYTSMEAVWSWASNSLETHPWWRTIKAGVFKNRYDYVLGFTAARRTQTSFFFLFFLPCGKLNGRLHSCSKTESDVYIKFSVFCFFCFFCVTFVILIAPTQQGTVESGRSDTLHQSTSRRRRQQ